MEDPFGDPFATTSLSPPSSSIVPSKPFVTPATSITKPASLIADPFDNTPQDKSSNNQPHSSTSVSASSFSPPSYVSKPPSPPSSSSTLPSSSSSIPADSSHSSHLGISTSPPSSDSTLSAAPASSSSSSSSSSTHIDVADSPAISVDSDELTLEDQGLTELHADIAKKLGYSLVKLDLTDNNFSSLHSFDWPYSAPSWPALTTLILDKNQLKSLQGLTQAIPSINTLWINNNKISDLDQFLDDVEKYFPNLTYLSMLRNPSCPDMYFSDGEMDAYARYRLYVIYRLKKLEFLDATPVTNSERKEAQLRGAFCRVAKVVSPSSSHVVVGVGGSPSSSAPRATVGLGSNAAKPPKVATFLAKGKPRYDGTNSEGNRFIMNEDL